MANTPSKRFPKPQRGGGGGKGGGSSSSSSRPRFQQGFLLLLGLWLLYTFATIVKVHELDPTSLVADVVASPHQLVTKQKEITRKAEKPTTTVENTNQQNRQQAAQHPQQEQPAEKAAAAAAAASESKKRKKKILRPNFRASPYGHMVNPDTLFQEKEQQPQSAAEDTKKDNNKNNIPMDQVLTAYLEPIDKSTWKTTPLPPRSTAGAENLTRRAYPKLNSCRRLPEQWPVDDYPDQDPFLPWIHDVFPTDDGKFIQFVAQNKRRCHTGYTDAEEEIVQQMEPQTSLMEHVPLKKVSEGRYRLASHEDADPESMETRFICRFKPSQDITFSVFNNDYEWVAYRKNQRHMFSEDGRDIKQIQTSQILFKCPVPDHLVETIKSGASVIDDWATIFVDVIPVRTPPRYGPPAEFLQPRYMDTLPESERKKIKANKSFDPNIAWGDGHILPQIEDSGRWENIPVCKPSLMTYEPEVLKRPDGGHGTNHRLVSCLWASTGYTTRGNRYAINDGQRRMLEWITFNKILGFDHFYIYDNSAAFTNETSLQPFVDLFPGDVTVIKWPSRVCNNRPNNVDSPGERSSQYAAESSCQLRFGGHTEWIGQFDIDEYLIPMGKFDSLLPLLDKLEKEDTRIISFASWRSWPRRTHINDPVAIEDKELCAGNQPCFELSVRKNTTMLEAYNCDRQKPGQKSSVMPAEKQLYRADYVTQHFIHYSTVTKTTNLPLDEFAKKFGNKRVMPDPKSRFGDEVNEGLMLHSKAIARQDTRAWVRNCQEGNKPFDQCRIGFPWPDGAEESGITSDAEGWKYNCYVNEKIDNYWAPKLQSKLKERGFL